MHTVEIITFAGCDTATKLIDQLKELQSKHSFDVKVVVVPSADKSATYGLYGSPTVLVNGEEYQKVIGGNPGFY